LGAFQQVAVDELAGEPDPDPAARHGFGVQTGRDEVIEGPVEVSQGDVHGDPGDGQLLTHRLVLRALRHGSVLPEPDGSLRQRRGVAVSVRTTTSWWSRVVTTARLRHPCSKPPGEVVTLWPRRFPRHMGR